MKYQKTLLNYTAVEEVMHRLEQVEWEEEEQRARERFEEWMRSNTCGDPYWRIHKRYIDFRRLGSVMQRYGRFERDHPRWVEDLDCGLPTYYGVLCLSKDAKEDEVEEAYERKKEHSSYPPEVVEEAYRVLGDKRPREEYDQLLRIFFDVSQALTPREKREIKVEHEDWLAHEKEWMTFEYIKKEHPPWFNLLYRGAPTFYEILGIDESLPQDQIWDAFNKQVQDYPDAAELLAEVYKVLNNPQLRWEYDFLLQFFEDNLKGTILAEFEERKRTWGRWEDKAKLLLLNLKYRIEDFKDEIDRWKAIMKRHNDWEGYLPPNKDTFYTVLGIDMDSLPDDKTKLRLFLHNRYKELEKSTAINLAYSVLKNSKLRSDYNWMLENHEWIKQLHDVETLGADVDPKDHKSIDELIQRLFEKPELTEEV